MTLPREIDFNALPAPVRARFVACLRREADPAPLFAESGTGESIAGSVGLGVVGVAALAVGAACGWGIDPRSAIPGGLGAGAFYLLGVFFAAFGAVRARAAVVKGRLLPWKPGRYFFPGAAIDARQSPLRVASIASLADVTVKTEPFQNAPGLVFQEVRLLFEGGHTETFAIAASGDQLKRAEVDRLRDVRDRLRAAEQSGDRSVAGELDPLADVPGGGGGTTYRGVGDGEGPQVLQAPRWTARPLALALVIAVAVVVLAALLEGARHGF